MSVRDWQDRFFETTRGRVAGALRCGPRTVDEIAVGLGVSDNAVRAHLQTLERDGMVMVSGSRRGDGVGKPAHEYSLTSEADLRFSRAYAPLLRGLLDALAERLEPQTMETVMRAAGAKLAPALGAAAGAPERAAAAARVLRDLGGQVVIEERPDGTVVRGCGCPLGAVTADHPSACTAIEAFLSAALGATVREACRRGARPECQFVIR